MIKKRYLLVLSVAIIPVLCGSLLYNNLALAGKPEPQPQPVEVTNFPLDEEGNLRISEVNGKATTREIAIHAIPETQVDDDYSKLGEFIVPAGKKWGICEITFRFSGNWIQKLMIKLVLRGMTMMDVRAVSLPYDSNGDSKSYTMDFEKPVELLENEKIELWARNLNPCENYCGLLIEAWVEDI